MYLATRPNAGGAIKALTVIGTNSNYLIKSHLMSPNGSSLPTEDKARGAKKQVFLFDLKYVFV